MALQRSGKRPRSAAEPEPRTAKQPAPPSHSPLQAAANGHHSGRKGEEEGDVDWAAEYEDVEEPQPAAERETSAASGADHTRGGHGTLSRPNTRIASSKVARAAQQPSASGEQPRPLRPWHALQYDYHFLLPAGHAAHQQPTAGRSNGIDPTAAYIQSMHTSFTTALTDRVSRLDIQPSTERDGGLLLSLVLSASSSSPFRVMDLGPETSSAAAVEWRSYWCERSELRRFKDGRVLECVLWRAESGAEVDEESSMGEASVLLRMVRWVMARKGQLKDTANIRFVGWQAHQLLKRRQLVSTRPLLFSTTASLLPSPSDAATLQSTFNALCALLKSLPLPLSFTSITAVHPSFRYTDPFPPPPLSADVLRGSASLPVIDVAALFESSSAWPSSLYAIQQIKTAFIIQLSSSLDSSSSPLLASTSVSYVHLDLQTREPAAYVFRLHLLHHGELQPLSFVLHQSLRSFALRHGEGGLWGGLVCLAKRWVQCHMWGEMVGEYVVELLCAAWWMEAGRGKDVEADDHDAGSKVGRQQTGGAPRGVSNPVVLLTGWLEWLARLDFASGPLVVPLPDMSAAISASLTLSTPSSQSSASSLLDRALATYKSRQADVTASKPLPSLYIATPFDLASSITSPLLNAALLSRLQLTAASCASHLTGLITRCQPSGWMTAFKPDLSSFDILLHIDHNVLSWDTLATSVGRVGRVSQPEQQQPRQHEEKEGQQWPGDHIAAAAAEVDESQQKRGRVRGFKPPIDEHKAETTRPHELLLGVDAQREYVRALQQHLGAFVDVHADLYGGSVIGVRLKRRAGGRWQVKDSGYSSWRRGAEGQRNFDEVVADMELIGQGIVERVELQTRRTA